MTDDFALSLIVFAFNEAENLPFVVQEIDGWCKRQDFPIEIVVVDDGSTDETSSVMQELQTATPLVYHSHSTNRGIGAALKTGVSLAAHNWVTFLPADGQISPDSLSTLIAAHRKSGAELVTSIYTDRNDGLKRTILSAGVRFLIKGIHGVSLQSDGPYLFKKRLFDPSILVPDSFFLNFEFPIRMLRANIHAEVVSISCRQRRSGHSKSSGMRTIYIIAKDLIGLRFRR